MVEEAAGGLPASRRVPTQCMNWHAYGIREIWHMLECEDGRISRNQIHAWGLMGSLCTHQADHLRRAWTSLADVWPPEGSRAAAAYRTAVLTMARSLDESATAAYRNAQVLAALTDGIARTRGTIAKLVQEYNTIAAERRHPKVSAAAAAELDREKAEIVERARQTMRDADAIPATAAADFLVPPPYLGIDASIEHLEPSQLSGQYGAGIIPRPVYSPPAPMPTSSSSQGSAGTPVWDEPALAGDASTPPSVGPTSANPVGPWPTGGGTTDGTNRGALGPGGAFGPGTVVPGRAGVPGGAVGPGGVIGSPAGTRAHTSSAQAARPGSAPGMLAPMVPPIGAAGAGQRTPASGASGSKRRAVPPSDDWQVPKGLPPVIEPPAEPVRHDPGPGVIGIDR